MSRNRYKKSGANTPSQKSPLQYSAAAKTIANRILAGGAKYLQDNIARVMIDSTQLADEPEFADLYLNSEDVVKVTDKWDQRYQQRLADAQNIGEDAYAETFDQMRIEIIRQLATPAFRAEVEKRHQALLERLMASDDMEKLELVMMLKPVLVSKIIPWGICGLILAIYQRTLQKENQIFNDGRSLHEMLSEMLEDGDERDIEDLLADPETLEQLEEKMAADRPDLMERMQNQVLEWAQAFEKELVDGKIVLDLFTKEEIYLILQRLEEKSIMSTLQSSPTDNNMKLFFDEVSQAISELMTPVRYQQFLADVETTTAAWRRKRKRWAAALQSELIWLDREQYENNKFVLAVFWSQTRRLIKNFDTKNKG